MLEQLPGATRHRRITLALTALLLAAAAVCPARAQHPGVWEPWRTETVSLAPRGSAQFRVVFADLPVRSWRLVVDGAQDNADVTVLRVKGEALLYARNNHARHVVDVPWGRGEEVIVTVTNRNRAGSFDVTLMGPPRDQVQAAYSYPVNRALEAYAAGRRLEAEDHCRRALIDDPHDAAAMVLMAGFQRDRGQYDAAAELVDRALAGDLAPEMMDLARDMRTELTALRAPVPAPLREGVVESETHLDKGRPGEALPIVDKLLDGELEMAAAAKSRLHLIRGRALAQLERNFEALDAFMTALQLNRTREGEAVIYHHMGRLYLAMENLQQARDACTMALQIGLPSGLDLRTREDLKAIDRALGKQR